MRLICPNCDAQYEVDSAVIPEGGRDVQCSSCGHTWFQTALSANAPDSADAPTVAAAIAPETLRRRTLDDAVLSVLREEAERETRAREAEGSSLETQTDLGLSAPPAAPPPQKPAAPPPQTAEVDPDDDLPDTDVALVARASRRELLPDIEEINSTLRPTSERRNDPASAGAPQTLRQQRNGFRRGFLTSIAGMSLLLLVYIFAGAIGRAVPASQPILGPYTAAVDGIRLWLENSMRTTTESLKSTDAPSG